MTTMEANQSFKCNTKLTSVIECNTTSQQVSKAKLCLKMIVSIQIIKSLEEFFVLILCEGSAISQDEGSGRFNSSTFNYLISPFIHVKETQSDKSGRAQTCSYTKIQISVEIHGQNL